MYHMPGKWAFPMYYTIRCSMNAYHFDYKTSTLLGDGC